MKTLVAYYSFEGNCRDLAHCMADAVGGETEELLPVEDPVPRSSVGKYFYGGIASLLRETTPLKPLNRHPHNYDLIVVGGPVWFFNITPVVRSFLSDTNWKDLRVACFAMHRGGKGMATSSMRSLVEKRGGRVLSTVEFVDLRRGSADATRSQAKEWISRIQTQ